MGEFQALLQWKRSHLVIWLPYLAPANIPTAETKVSGFGD
jgi:hypothetical protein